MSTEFRKRAVEFWQDALYWQARSCPILGKTFKPLAMQLGWRCSAKVRDATRRNARRIFGPDVTMAQIHRYTVGLLSTFFDFINDVGGCVDMSDDELRAQVEFVAGDEHYKEARAAGKGAIVATAHMGSFEAAAAALLPREKKLHIVFKRDTNRFEQLRSSLRQRMGVIEAPVDDGWGMWLRLREALQRDEIVMLQADRCMPGQKGQSVPFLHGHLEVPTGPIKLALASGAPIVPTFALRTPANKIRIHVEPAIWVSDSDQSPHPALLKLTSILEKYVAAHPQQWLVLHRAFVEDQVA
jgi:phosphatidylinositol dimannoside acyltransferase